MRSNTNIVLLHVIVAFLVVGRVPCGVSVRALDGQGHPVAWWAVLKLPSQVQTSEVVPTPCDCPPPDCSNVGTAGSPDLKDRAPGLCYLYADAKHPEFRHFRDLGYDCLGQGGNDPVSHTLKQKDNEEKPYWALFNDQLYGIAGPKSNDSDRQTDQLQRSRPDQGVCGGGDLFSAHAKGAVAFSEDGSGGYFLQTSTPNFPDPTLNESFVRLGCQKDNNVHFAQHLLALSLEDSELRTLGQELQLARLCSGNFYQKSSLHDLLASASFYTDGASQDNTTVSAFYHALLDPSLPVQTPTNPMKSAFKLKLSGQDNTRTVSKTRVFEPLADAHRFADLINDTESQSDDDEVLVLVKSPRAAVPPWAMVADALHSDVSVASWWDGSFGIPTICAGDVFTNTPNEFCLNNPSTGVQLNADGSAPYNIENLLQARWHSSDGSANFTWQLVGGRVSDGNHAKWGIATPRSGIVNVSSAYVTFGDLNMEGFPCSKSCNGSQAGRGGSFFSLLQPRLHQSLAEIVISSACHCSSPQKFETATGPDLPSFEQLRMCHRGCVKKVEEKFTSNQLPTLSDDATSFWH